MNEMIHWDIATRLAIPEPRGIRQRTNKENETEKRKANIQTHARHEMYKPKKES
jgi:hypothetical protein